MGDNKYFVFCIFERYIEFVFFIQFWYVFCCCWMKCVTCFRKYVDNFFNLLLNNTHYFFTEVLLYWVTIEHQILCTNECNNLSFKCRLHWTLNSNLHMNNQVSDTDSGEPLVINKNSYVQLPVSIHLINVNTNVYWLHHNYIVYLKMYYIYSFIQYCKAI
jgi:hypothetical protein